LLACIRSLYGRPDLDIRAQVEGDTRTNDLAHAIVAEHRLAGLPVKPSIMFSQRYHADKRIPPVDGLDVDNSGLSVHVPEQQGYYARRENAGNAEPSVPRVLLSTENRYFDPRTAEGLIANTNTREPVILINVFLDRSKPRGIIRYTA